MIETDKLMDQTTFSAILFEKMKLINAAIKELENYEFQYCLNNLIPQNGWGNVCLKDKSIIEILINQYEFYESIHMKPKVEGSIVLDQKIVTLTNMLFVGIVSGKYEIEWIKRYFYFDVRGFFFLPRTNYFNEENLKHFGGKPYVWFEKKQIHFEKQQDIGYREFKEANTEVDKAFIKLIEKLIEAKGTPLLLTIAGPTAAGKTEIVDRLRDHFEKTGKKITTVEMDNFFLDREIREKKSPGIESMHFELFKTAMEEIINGKNVLIPRYNFINATSSHDANGNLRTGCKALEIEASDIILLEGNFPFHLEEISHFIGTIIVYLTDDAIRLKRKWKRDIDYRKKYEPTYFRNRFFRTQYLRAKQIYLPLMNVCDVVVDTTGAAIWMTDEFKDAIFSVEDQNKM